MRFGLRLRFAVWLLVALLPVGAMAFAVFGRMENEVMDRIAVDLGNVRRAETARIDDVLDRYADGARRLARRPATVELVQALTAADDPTGTDAAEPSGPAETPSPAPPLDPAIAELMAAADATMSDIAAVRIVDPQGRILAETVGFDESAGDQNLVGRISASEDLLFGRAHTDSAGNPRLRVAAAITTSDLQLVGVVLVENDLEPIVDIVAAHNERATGSAAFLVEGDDPAELVAGPPAGDPDMPADIDALDGSLAEALPVEMAVRSMDGFVSEFEDTSGHHSLVSAEAIDGPHWGFLLQVDRSDALEPIVDEVRSLKGLALVGLLLVWVGWAGLLDPVARRLRRLAEGAERVANGDYETPLDDRTSDEIGTVAKSIDRLATDLAADIAVRADIEQRLRYQATHDPLTGLHNRQYATALMHDLARAAVEATPRPDGAIFSLLFLDLDRFKAINDRFGHAAGDAVLAQAGERLLGVVGDHGTVARWGGDEFVVVLPRFAGATAAAVGCNVEDAFAEPMVIEGVAHDVRPSVGSATFRAGDRVGDLLRSADSAMFADKQRRRQTALRSPEATRSVEHALEDDLVDVVFQPLVAGRSDDTLLLLGAEALVRISGADGRPLAPAQFLSAIEGTSVARDLDRRVLELALRHGARWIRSGSLPGDFRLSVNCSHAFLSDADTPDFVCGALVGVSLLPRNLMLEIAEPKSEVERANIARLHRIGVRIAFDDVDMTRGTLDGMFEGGASVAKIDQRLAGPARRTNGRTVAAEHAVRDLVSMCDSLGYDVIAENVETMEQYVAMRDLGVSEFQGYLFAHPLTVSDFTERFCNRI